MLLEIYQIRIEYSRNSKKGKSHAYFRKRSVARLLCDSCGTTFERPVKQMDPRRLTDEHTHVCPTCDTKRFAQSKGAESRRFWNTTVDRDIGLGDL
jgi:hypothetical protein